MSLDASTFTLAGGFVAFCSGTILLVYWWQDPKAWPAFWWALGNCGSGIGIILLALHSVLPFEVSNVVGPLILDCSAVCIFVAARIFNRGSVNPYRTAACAAALLTMLALSGVYTREQFAATLGTSASGSLVAAAALEFWLGRSEKLRGRMLMIVILLFYAIALFLVALGSARATTYSLVPSINWLGAIHFVALGYALGVTAVLIMMLKGRTEETYKLAAFTDPLTGLLNRRAFMEQAQRLLDRGGQDGSPVAFLAFDLDRFKRINDRFGHATGDQVLRTFADVLASALRPMDICARIGGEEFVAVVPGAGDEAAMAIASRICDTLQKAAQFLAGQKIEATVSAGVATTGGQPCDVADLLASADAALYHAKNAGRNRVALADKEPIGLPSSNVVRIA